MSTVTFFPVVSSGGGTAVGWEATSFAWAQGLLPTLNSSASSDLNDGKAFAIGTLNTISAAYNNGAYQIGSGGTGAATLGNTATQISIVSPKVEVWAVRARLRIAAASVTALKFIQPFAIYDLAANGFSVLCIAAQSTTIFQAAHHYNGGASNEYFSCGSVGTMGASTCPTAAFFTVGATFDGTSIRVYFNDTLALTLAGAQLNNMVTAASYVYLSGNDAAATHVQDSIFVATVRST